MSAIRFSIIVLITALLAGCGASATNDSEILDALEMRARLLDAKKENEGLRLKLEAVQAKQKKEERIRKQVASKIRERGLDEDEERADPAKKAKRERPLDRLLANVVNEVNPAVCRGGVGPGAAYVGGFPMDIRDSATGAIHRGSRIKSACGGRCLAIRNNTAHYIALYIDGRAVTVCDGTRPAQTLLVKKPGHEKATRISVVSPNQLAKIGGLFSHVQVKARYFDTEPFVMQVKEDPRLVSKPFPHPRDAWGYEHPIDY